MTNLERIQAQKQEVNKEGKPITPITQEILNDMIKRNNENFTSGRPKQVGDWLLFGFLHELKGTETNLSLITLHEEEYGTIYEDAPNMREINSIIMLELVKK